MNNERYLLVSLGSIGRRHLRNLRQLRPEATIAVLRQQARIDDVALPEGANVLFRDIEEAIAFAPAAAIIAGPASAHIPIALRLAVGGVHLFLEKPISDSSDEVESLIDLCRTRELTLMVGYNLRFLPSLNQAKQCLESGLIGDVRMVRAEVGQYLPDWRPGIDYRQSVSARAELGGGVLLELSHELDYLYWFFGIPDFVTARGGRYGDLEIDVEDTVELVMEYACPARLVSVHLDMIQRAPTRQCRFVGTEGTLLWDGLTDRIDLFQAGAGSWETIATQRFEDRNQMYIEELAHFLRCVAQGGQPLINGRNGLDVLSVIQAAKTSMAMSRSVGIGIHEIA